MLCKISGGFIKKMDVIGEWNYARFWFKTDYFQIICNVAGFRCFHSINWSWGSNSGSIIFKLLNSTWGTQCELALRWMPKDLTNEKSTLVQLMTWWLTAPSHYMSQSCWPTFMCLYGVTQPWWVKVELRVNNSSFAMFSNVYFSVNIELTVHVIILIGSVCLLLWTCFLLKNRTRAIARYFKAPFCLDCPAVLLLMRGNCALSIL